MNNEKSTLADDAFIGMSRTEINNYSLLRLISAQLTGDWSRAGLEQEASSAAAGVLGRAPIGTFIPYDVLADGRRDLDSTTGAGLIGTDHQPDSLIEAIRNESVISRVGATVMPGLVGDVDIPKQGGVSTATWIDNEGGEVTSESTPTYTTLSLRPKTLRVRVDASRKMLKQSRPRVEELIRRDLAAAIGQKLDDAAISGAGTSIEPQGIVGATGISSLVLGDNGAALTWENLVEMETLLGNHQREAGQAYVLNTATKGALKTSPRHSTATVGGFLIDDDGKVNGHPCLTSDTLPADGTKGTGTNLSTMIFGAWSSLVIGMWGGLDLVADKITLGNMGGIVLIGFQDVDLGLRYPGAFTVCEEIVTG